MSEPLDFLGNPIEVGDSIVWADAGGRHGSMRLYKTVVTRLTEKQVLVDVTTCGKQLRPFRAVVVVDKGGTEE